MPAITRQVYIISDLHLGGRYPNAADPDDRGFRICTHTPELVAFVDALAKKPASDPVIDLVINGDMVDFLAEREPNPPHWVPFTTDQDDAVGKLKEIIKADISFFVALRGFLERGHRLVLLLGNHDIELSLPRVRQTLLTTLGVDRGRDFQFFYDGEAYLVGDALIEHGNRYDQFNVVDMDSLRHCRSLLSRHQDIPQKYAFNPPAGSKMVATVINPIKEDYRFVDLLKPEDGAVIPLLLAIEPGYRGLLGQAAKLALESREHRLETAALPSFAGDIAYDVTNEGADFSADIAGGVGPLTLQPEQALEKVLQASMGHSASQFLDGIQEISATDAGDIADTTIIDRAHGLVRLARLALDKPHSEVEKRLPLLLDAFRALQDDQTFNAEQETAAEYLNAARALASHGIRHVVFGHTHMAKKIELTKGGGFYLNSGTWANVMKFPAELIAGSHDEALGKVREFVRLMVNNDFSAWTLFRPTYVRLDLDAGDHVTKADLCQYTGPDAV